MSYLLRVNPANVSGVLALMSHIVGAWKGVGSADVGKGNLVACIVILSFLLKTHVDRLFSFFCCNQ